MDVRIFDNYEFFTGVPDSQLKPLCDWLLNKYGLSPDRHIIAANEGNAVAIAAGYHLATGKIPVVYLQNSGMSSQTPPCFADSWAMRPGTDMSSARVMLIGVSVSLMIASRKSWTR